MKPKRVFFFIILVVTPIIFYTCNNTLSPKQRGYYRIDLPKKEYIRFDTIFPYTFDYPKYARIVVNNADSAWINIIFDGLNGQINITYKRIENNLPELFEDSRTFVNKHIVKADAIGEELFMNEESKVYGIKFNIKGNAATPLQFYLTDSVKHFLRGSLIFNSVPNKDSLAPVIDFVELDLIRLINSFEWK